MTPAPFRVVTAIAKALGLSVDQVLSRERLQSTALARMTALYVLREHQVPRPSFPELGREFSLDHSTVISACQRVARRVAEPAVANLIEAGRAALENEQPRDTLLAKCHELKAIEARREQLRREIEELSGIGLGAAQ